MKSTKSPTIGRPDEIRTSFVFRRRTINLFAVLVMSAGLSLTSAVAATVQNLFVTVRSGTVYMLTGNGTVSTFVSGLNEPFGVICDSAGNVYVATWGGGGIGSGNVYKYNPQGVLQSTVSGFSEPTHMACDSSGNVYVSDYGDGIIYKVTGGTKSVFDSGLYYPSGITFDSAGSLYVADGNGNVYQYFNSGGTLGSRTLFNPGSQFPVGSEEANYFSLSFDSAGHLFVADYDSGEIYEFYQGSVSDFASTAIPMGLSFDSMGDLFEGGGSRGNINEYANNGSLNSTPATFASNLGGVTDLAFQPQVCSGLPIVQNLFAAAQSGTIYMFTPNGTKSTFTSGLSEPFGLAFDSVSNLYVSTWNGGGIGSGYVYKYNPQGVLQSTVSGFSEPTYMAFNSLGNLYVSDYGDGIIYKVSGGTKSTFATGLYYPSGVAFDGSNDLFVADGNGNIHEYANNGGTLSTTPTTFASGLTVANEEVDYFSISFDSGGDLFAADYANGEIYKFPFSSGSGLQPSPSNFASEQRPLGLAFDIVGDLFSGDQSDLGSIYEYPYNGSLDSAPSASSTTFAQRVANGYQLNDVAFQPAEPVPYGYGAFLSTDLLPPFPAIPFYSGVAYSQIADTIYATAGPDPGSSYNGVDYNGDAFTYGISNNLDYNFNNLDDYLDILDSGGQYNRGTSPAPTPTVASDGTTYVVTPSGVLYALRLDGSLKWAVPYYGILYDGGNVFASPTIGLDGNVYIATDNGNQIFTLFCIDPELGLPKWEVNYNVSNDGDPDIDASPAATPTGLFAENEGSHFQYFTYYGQGYTPFSYSGQGGNPCSSPAVTPQGLLCIGDSGGNLDIVDTNPPDLNGGKILQFCSLDGHSIAASPVIGPDGNAYIGTSGGNFYAVQLPANERINPPAIIAAISLPSSSQYPTTAAVGTNSEVYVGTSANDGGSGPGYLFSMHLQPVCGQQYPEQFVVDWQYTNAGAGFIGSPLIAQVGSNHSTNVVYAPNKDGNVYGFYASAGPGTNWSTFKGNDQRQGNWGTGSIPLPELWNAQFGPSGGQLGQTGKAAYGNTDNDYWNACTSGNQSYVYDYTDNNSPNSPSPLTMTVSSTGLLSGTQVSSQPFNDNMMDYYMYSATANTITVTISGLPTHALNSSINGGNALYDIYVYSYGGKEGSTFYNSEISISPNGKDPVQGTDRANLATESQETTCQLSAGGTIEQAPPTDFNNFTQNYNDERGDYGHGEYVVFHNVPVTLSDPVGSGEIQITVTRDPNNSASFPLINGIQIVAKQ